MFIHTNKLPLWVEPLVVWMCFEVELLLHLIPICNCHLAKEILAKRFCSAYFFNTTFSSVGSSNKTFVSLSSSRSLTNVDLHGWPRPKNSNSSKFVHCVPHDQSLPIHLPTPTKSIAHVHKRKSLYVNVQIYF